MSGLEAPAVLAMASVITIMQGLKQVYDAAKHVQVLPKAFNEVAARLPLVETTLDLAKKQLEKRQIMSDGIDQRSLQGVQTTVEACERKARKLDEIFRKAVPSEPTSSLDRYYHAVKVCGKGNEVEKLMEGILKDVQVLSFERGMRIKDDISEKQISEAIARLSLVEPSVPAKIFHETPSMITNPGPGTQYNAQGENVAQGNARQYNSAGGAMHFGTE